MTLALDLKSTRLNALLLPLRSRDLDAVLAQARAQWGAVADAFELEPLVLDLRALPPEGAPLDWPRLLQGLRVHGLQPVAALGLERLTEAEQQSARRAGLHASDDAATPRSEPAAPAAAVPQPAASRALVIDRPLRSGQQVYARDSDLIVLGLVSHGAEVIADGNVHVYGALRGRAIAGAKGDSAARVFAQSLEPELIAIAGTFRTSEKPLPPDVLAKPAQARLVVQADGERLVFEPLKY